MQRDDPLQRAAEAWRYREFSPPVFDAWLTRLCDQGYCALLVGIMMKLGRMVQAPLDGAQRLATMRALVPIVDDLHEDLPTGPPVAPKGLGTAPCTLAQRLGKVTYANLKRALEALDQGRGGLIGAYAEGRLWLVTQMFKCLGRQIELSARWGKSWLPNTWQELHDLFAYCNSRLSAFRWGSEERLEPLRPDGIPLDPLTAYKRLLLIGLCAQEGAGSLWLSAGAGSLDAWAQTSELRDPAAYMVVIGACLVDLSGDAPPRRIAGALGEASGARALVVPADFLAALAAAKTAPRGGAAS